MKSLKRTDPQLIRTFSMKIFLWVAVLLAEILAAPLAQAQENYGLVTFQNRESFIEFEAKLIGPTSRTIHLGTGEDETVIVAPGKYYCLFHIRENGLDRSDYYKKEEEFTVPNLKSQSTPVLVKPSRFAPPGEFITEDEFNKVTLPDRPPDSDLEKLLDPLRLTTIDVTVSIKNLYYGLFYGENEELKKEHLRIASSRMNDFVRRLLLPKLVKQGFGVNYLGFDAARKQPDHGLLVIDYDEQKGAPYSRTITGTEPKIYGVYINCSLKLMHPSVTTGTPVWLRQLTAGNSFYVSGSLYTDALDNLEASFKEAIMDLHNWAPRNSNAPAVELRQNKLPRRRQLRRNKP